MDNKTALEKIKKCLALSQSANEHEAAQALKQVQALMRKYELSEHDVELSKVTEAGSERKVARSLSNWQWGVGHLVADVFGCYFYKEGKVIRFYGLGNRAELAAYAFDVVYRQISTARRKFLREKVTNLFKSVRSYLADRYCEGWLCGAKDIVQDFAMPEKETALMKTYMDSLNTRTVKGRGNRVSGYLDEASDAAMIIGSRDGKDIQLHHAMNGADGVKRIEGGL
nr:MAG TPA: Protein of unknown function (DUF2786) [Caudoviricetes sp.]